VYIWWSIFAFDQGVGLDREVGLAWMEGCMHGSWELVRAIEMPNNLLLLYSTLLYSGFAVLFIQLLDCFRPTDWLLSPCQVK